MVFSSIPFLFFFFPAFMILYYAVPEKAKNYILLVFSLVFYAWGEPVYIFLMLFVTLMDYIIGRLMDKYGNTGIKRKLFLLISVCVDVFVLFFFKYVDFFINIVNKVTGANIENLDLPLPIGISFFIFQTLSYTIDLYRKKVEVEKNYFYYLTYVSMFPQLIAGPIVRFETVRQELHKRTINLQGFTQGMYRFLMGLFKKVILANNLGNMWESIKAMEVSQVSVLTAWVGAATFTLQLYLDFSAYSDMAIGMGKMLGFNYLENFNYPLSATSITDFWRRWHISLSGWFRDYIYIPLGGNRCSAPRHIMNIMIVWFLTGMWHGASANYILWGVYYGIILLIEKYFLGKYIEKLPTFFRHLYAVVIVVFGFTIFVFEDFSMLTSFISGMFGVAGNAIIGTEIIQYLVNYGVILVFAVIISAPVFPALSKKITVLYETRTWVKPVVQICASVCIAVLFLVTVSYLVSASYNPFLYFRF